MKSLTAAVLALASLSFALVATAQADHDTMHAAMRPMARRAAVVEGASRTPWTTGDKLQDLAGRTQARMAGH